MAYSSYEAAKKAADKVGGQASWSSAGGWDVVGGNADPYGTAGGTANPFAGATGGAGSSGAINPFAGAGAFGSAGGDASYWNSTPLSNPSQFGGVGIGMGAGVGGLGGIQLPGGSGGGSAGGGSNDGRVGTYPNLQPWQRGGIDAISGQTMGQLQDIAASQIDPSQRTVNPFNAALSAEEQAELEDLMNGGGGTGDDRFTPPDLTGTVQDAPGLYRKPDGTYVDEMGNAISATMAEYIKQQYYAGGATEDQGMSEWETAQMNQWTQQNAWEQQQSQMNQEWQQQQMQWQQEQARMQQQIQERQLSMQEQQIAAQLAASPSSWLEYASYMGESPTVQDWMMPLMPQEYAGLQAGDEIPNWTEGDMSDMPELVTPSQQYLARMGPQALEQYYAYLKALLGITGDQTGFKLESMAPPGGQNTGLYQNR